MSYDVGAMRAFLTQWKPVVDTLPGVIDALANVDDIDRALTLKRVELEAAKAEVQKVYDDADERLKAVNEVLASAQADVTAAKAEAKELRTQATARAKAAEAKLADAAAVADMALMTKRTDIAGLDQVYAMRKAEAEAAHAAVVAELDAKTKDAEKRFAAAEKALESLKSKLG